METTTSTVRLAARLNGPPQSANGGFACGTIAQDLGGTASVRLIRPIPLESRLELQMAADGLAVVTDSGQHVVAEARRVEPFTMTPPVRPGFADARRHVPPVLSEGHATCCRRASCAGPNVRTEWE